MDYIIVYYNNKNFKKICDYIEKEIVEPNLSKNGGTLNYQKLTYKSDLLILCIDQNKIVGFNSIIFFPKDTLYIYQIGVLNKYKNKGIGTNLMKQAVDIAIENDLYVSAHVMDYNTYSKKLMEKIGLKKLSVQGKNSFYSFKPINKNKSK